MNQIRGKLDNGERNGMVWYKFSLDNTSGLMKPIIFCTSSEIEELSEAYSMNIPIAKELQKSGSL